MVTNTMSNMTEPLLKLCTVINWDSVCEQSTMSDYGKPVEGVSWGMVLHRNICNALKVCGKSNFPLLFNQDCLFSYELYRNKGLASNRPLWLVYRLQLDSAPNSIVIAL